MANEPQEHHPSLANVQASSLTCLDHDPVEVQGSFALASVQNCPSCSKHRLGRLTASFPNYFSRFQNCRAFTLIELVIVLVIIGAMFVLGGSRLGIVSYWEEENFLRKLKETISFLHQQAVIDQEYYELDFDFEKLQYQIHVLHSDPELSHNAEALNPDIGDLSRELAILRSPALGQSYTKIPPPSFPSLEEAVKFPRNIQLESIKTQRGTFDGTQDDASAYILFSPRGFSEFAVIHFNQGEEGKLTLLVNPFVGSSTLYRDERDFDWSFGRNKKGAEQ